MAAPIPGARTDVPAAVNRGWSDLTTAGAREGCTACGSQDTTTVDGVLGRRCEEHPPEFDPTHAVELHRHGAPGAAMSYVRAWSDQ